MICPSCGTWNRTEAWFCKGCGFDLTKSAAAPPAGPSPAAPPAPGVARRVWWHGLGVFAILASFVLFLDLTLTGRATWSLVVVLGLAFLVGAIMILQFLASVDQRDRRPFIAGAVLLAAAVILLPVAVTSLSSPTTTESFQVGYSPAIAALNLVATSEAGRITVGFVTTTTYLVRADVTHVGGLFSSHRPGDVTATNATTGSTLSFTLTARGAVGLFFFGGHDIVVSVHRSLSVALTVQSTTGNVGVSIPAGVAVRSIDLTVTTGSVDLATRDVAFADGATVRGTSTTGSVALTIDQALGPAGTVGVFGTSTTGPVSFTFNHGPDAAARVVARVTTGSVNVDSGKYESTGGIAFAPDEAGYQAASLKFNVELTSTTGGVRIG